MGFAWGKEGWDGWHQSINIGSIKQGEEQFIFVSGSKTQGLLNGLINKIVNNKR